MEYIYMYMMIYDNLQQLVSVCIYITQVYTSKTERYQEGSSSSLSFQGSREKAVGITMHYSIAGNELIK